ARTRSHTNTHTCRELISSHISRPIEAHWPRQSKLQSQILHDDLSSGPIHTHTHSHTHTQAHTHTHTNTTIRPTHTTPPHHIKPHRPTRHTHAYTHTHTHTHTQTFPSGAPKVASTASPSPRTHTHT